MGAVRTVALAAVALIGCSKHGHGPARLYSPSELQALAHDLESEVVTVAKANDRESCVRPVLRGDVRHGRAGTAMARLFELAGDALKACTDAAIPVDGALDPACRPWVAGVVETVRYDDACTPYRLGVRWPVDARLFVRAGYELDARAQVMARKGDGVGGILLLLDAVRFTQDLSRGGGTIPVWAAARASAVRWIRLAREIITHHQLAPADLDRVASELDGLLASEDDFGALLESEAEELMVDSAAPALVGPDWRPPGAWPPGATFRGPTQIAGGGERADPMQMAAVEWQALSEYARAARAACPVHASREACADALKKQASDFQHGLGKGGNESLGHEMSSGMGRQITREHALMIVKEDTASSFCDYPALDAQRLAEIISLRVQVKAERMQATAGRCPTVDELIAATEAIRGDPDLGGQVGLRAGTGGSYVLTEPRWLSAHARRPQHVIARLRCAAD